jgi:phosphoglycolate phosphatase-like HAD superfamily hydrolase
MTKIKILVFDFDGTLVDSNAIKHDAYFELFNKDVATKSVVAENISRKPRWDVIEDILRALEKGNLLEFEDIKEEVERGMQKYGEIIEKEIINSNGLNGSFKALWKLIKKYKIYINSGTPTKPLKKVVQKLVDRKKIPQLAGVFGRKGGDETATKIVNLEKIRKAENASMESLVMIGDDLCDLESARIFGCKFIGIPNERNVWENESFPLLTDYKNLPKILKEVM